MTVSLAAAMLKILRQNQSLLSIHATFCVCETCLIAALASMYLFHPCDATEALKSKIFFAESETGA